MEDCRVWCDNLEKFYYECKILNNSTEPLTSLYGNDIVKAGIGFTWDHDVIDGVGIFVNNNFVLFRSNKRFFDSSASEKLSSFSNRWKTRYSQRKYSFCTLYEFFENIHKLRKNDFTIELDNDEIMDYLYNGINKIEGYYLFVDYSVKKVYISKCKHAYDCSSMEETNKGFEWDLEYLP